MRKRVLEELGERARDVAHRLRIETIDAFCMSLARQLPVLAKFGAPPGIADDARELYDEAAARVVADFDNRLVARLLAHLDNNVGAAVTLVSPRCWRGATSGCARPGGRRRAQNLKRRSSRSANAIDRRSAGSGARAPSKSLHRSC